MTGMELRDCARRDKTCHPVSGCEGCKENVQAMSGCGKKLGFVYDGWNMTADVLCGIDALCPSCAAALQKRVEELEKNLGETQVAWSEENEQRHDFTERAEKAEAQLADAWALAYNLTPGITEPSDEGLCWHIQKLHDVYEARLERQKPYLQHKPECAGARADFYRDVGTLNIPDCDCGFEEATK